MYKKIILVSALFMSVFVSQVFAVSDVYVKNKSDQASNLDYLFTYNDNSLLEFATTRLYCGVIYVFGSSSCYEKSTTTQTIGQTSLTVNNPNTAPTAPPASIVIVQSTSTTPAYIPQPTYTQPQNVYQVIERVIERAVPGPKGDKGDKGDPGTSGSTVVGGQPVGSSGYYSSYVSGAQYNGTNSPNPTYTTVNTGSLTSGSINTGSLTASGTTNLATTTINGNLNLGNVASGSATSSILVYGPNGEVQQITAAEMLASNTTNVIAYGNDASNTLQSTINGVVSTTTIGTLNNVNLTGTTTSQNIVNSGNFLTNFLSAVTGYISNLFFDNATGTNLTATGTASLANIVASNATITNLVASSTITDTLTAASGTVGSIISNASGTAITGTTSISGPLFATNTTLGGNTTINGGTTTINGVVVNNATTTNNGEVVNNSTTTNNGTSIFNGIAQFFNDVFNYGDIFNFGTTTNNGVVINNNEVFNNATTTNNGPVVNNGPVTNYGTTTLEGPVVVNGTTTFNGVVDLSNASVTFPNSPIANATITNLVFENATGTNLTLQNASITNATATNFFADMLTALSAFFTNLTATNAVVTNLSASSTLTNELTVTGTSTLTSTSINGTLTLNPVASGSATSSILVYGPNGEVQQITAAEMLASNTTNVIAYGNDASNTLTSTVNGVVSTTSITSLNNLNLTGTTTSQNIVNSGNFLTNFLSAVTGYISNLFFDNATGTNLTATGTASLANVIATNTLSTNIEGTNATLTNATATNFFAANASLTNATISNLAVDSISVPNTLSSAGNVMTSNVGGSISTTTTVNSNSIGYASNVLTSNVNGVVATTSLAGLVTANNGLTVSPSNNVQLGGTLIQDTTVDGQGFSLSLIKNRLLQLLGNFVEIGQDGGNTFNGSGYQVAVGNANTLNNDYNTAIGDRNTVGGTQAVAIGYENSFNSNDNTYVMGRNNTNGGTAGSDNMTFGYQNTNKGNDSVYLIGHDNTSSEASNEYIIGYSNNSFGSGSKDNYIIGESNDLSAFSGSHFINLGSYFTGNGSMDRVAVVGFNNSVVNSANDASMFGNYNIIDSANNAYILGANITNNVSGSVDIGTTDSTKITVDGGGRLTLRGAFNVTGSDGNSGDLLISQGSGVMPQWQSPASILAGATTNTLGFATSTKVLTSTVNGVIATTSLNNTFWALTGNSGTASTTNFLGTTDNMGLNFRTNNTNRMHITDSGNVGIGLVGVGGFDASVPSANKNLEIRSNTPTMRLSVTNYFAGGVYADIYRTTKGLFIDNYGANFTPSGDIRLRTHANGNIKLNPNELVGSGTGRVGINIAGDTAPVDMLELNSGIASDSGLTFTQMTSSTTGTTGAKPIGVTSAGKVVTIDSLLGLSTLAIGTTTVPSGKVATFQGDIDVSGTIDPTRILFSNLAGVNSPSYTPSSNGNNYRIEFAEGGGLNFQSASTSNILQLNNDGKVGVGISNPARRFEVQDTSGNIARFGWNASDYLDIVAGGVETRLESSGTRPFKIRTNGADRVSVFSSGNVSVGSTADVDRFFVSGDQVRFDLTGVGSQSFLFNNDGGKARIFSTAGIDYQSNVTTGIQHTFANDIGAAFAGTDFMTIDSRSASTTVGMNILKVQSAVAQNALVVKNDGNVGIGTSNPLYKFVISGGGAQGLEMNPASSTLFDILSYNRSTGQYIDTRLTAANFDFRAAGAGIPTMYMTNSGRKVGMGTSTPRAILDIIGAGTSSTTNSLMVSNSSNVNILTVRDDGRIGVGTTTPGNALHIASSTISKGISGLRLGITNASTTKSATTTSRVLSVDANGDVVMATVPGTQNVVDFFVNANPNTAGTTFTPNQPQDGDVIYVSDIDNSTWIWDGAAYVTYTAPASTEWMLSNSTTDAGSNKNSTIWRNGTLGIGTSTPNSIITAISTNTRPIITMGNTVNNTGNWSSMFAQTSTNTGTHSFIAGYQQNNTGPYSVMFGRQASNTANYSLLAGFNSQNSSQYSVLIGNGLTNNIGSDGSALFGGTNNNSGLYSVLGGSAGINTATGDYSAMFGVSGYNEGSYSLIAGRLASNTAPYSVVVGNVNTNTGSNSFIGGSSNVNAGAQSILYGNNNQNAASGQYAYLFGGSASNTGTYSILAGSSLKNSGHYNAVFGSSNSLNSGNYNIMSGINSSTTGSSNIIGGQSQENNGNYNIIAGYNNVNTGQGSAILGYSINNAANYTGIFGLSNVASGSYHLISGYNNAITGTYNLVSGANHTVNADQNIVGGNQHNVVGNGNLVMGYSHNATGTYSIITGYNNDNSGNFSAVFGQSMINTGNFSAVFGQSMVNNGTNSLLAGSNNTNNGGYNTLFGSGNDASGTYSLIAGSSNVQTGGTRSFLLAYNSTSTKDYSFTTGTNHINDGERSAMFNNLNENYAGYSFTAGSGNINRSYLSTIFGRYAEEETTSSLAGWTATNSLFVVGNGTNGTTGRNNALTLLKSGNLGIGTSTPQSLLHVYGNSATPIIAERTNAQNVNMEFKNTIGSWFAGQNQTGEFAIGMSNNLGTGAPFYIATTSYVGIGTNAPTANLHASGTVRFSSFGAGTLTTDASGNVTASSDERLKDIQGDYTRGLEDLRKIKPIKYKWNDISGLERENVYSGFSAQNVGEAIPEAVSTDPRGFLSLQERPILAALVNAVKEIADKLDKFAEVVSTKLIQTDRLCIGSTCVDEAQLQQMLNNQNTTSLSNQSTTEAPSTTETTVTEPTASPENVAEVATPTEQVVAESAPAPVADTTVTEPVVTEPAPAE